MTYRGNLLKARIRNKLRRHSNIEKFKGIDFRKLRGHPARYPPTVPSLLGAGLTVDDAFFMSEGLLKETGEFLGKNVYGYSKKESDRQNALLQNLNWLEHKTHHTHSGFQKSIKLMNKFSKVPILDTPMPVLKKKIWNMRIKGV